MFAREGTVRLRGQGDTSSMIARRFLVSGRVQGVGFRFFITRTAARLGVTGWTRNLADGRVEVMAQGNREALEALKADLSSGPRTARVLDLEIGDETPDVTLMDFNVRY